MAWMPTRVPDLPSAEAFFALPVEEKMACQIPGVGGNFGFTPFGQEHAKDEARADLKEFYHFAQAHYDQPVYASVPAFTEGGRDLYAALEALAIELLKAVALGLDLPEDHFTDQVRGGNSILRVLHYPRPRTPQPMPPGRQPRRHQPDHPAGRQLGRWPGSLGSRGRLDSGSGPWRTPHGQRW